MAKVFFTAHLKAVAPGGGVETPQMSVGGALNDVFARYPAARGYVLDDQGRMRLHIAVFVDGVHVRKDVLDYGLTSDSEVYIMQALSGG